MTADIAQVDGLLTVEQLIDKAGGPAAISLASSDYQRSIGVKGVYKWPVNGIPDWHWQMMMNLSGATEAQLHAANQAVREIKRRRERRRVRPNQRADQARAA